MTPSELRKAAEYVRDNDGYGSSPEYCGVDANDDFIAHAKKLAEAWLRLAPCIDPDNWSVPLGYKVNWHDVSEALHERGHYDASQVAYILHHFLSEP